MTSRERAVIFKGLKHIVARREFDHGIVAEVGTPVLVSARDAFWACPYQVRGVKPLVKFYAGGVDSLQALDLALVGVTSHLEGMKLSFGGEPAHDALALGLPSTMLSVSNAVDAVRRGRRIDGATRTWLKDVSKRLRALEQKR